MASVSVSASQSFPEGQSVGAYERRAKNPGGAPVGAAIVSAAVTGGVVTLSHAGIVLGGLYTAYALVSGQHRYVDFSPSRSDVSVGRDHGAGIKVVEVSVDLPSIAVAPSAVDVNVPVPSGTCKPGDIVVGGFLSALNAGLLVQGMGCVATDSIRLRVSNTTAGAIDPAAASAVFAIIKV